MKHIFWFLRRPVLIVMDNTILITLLLLLSVNIILIEIENMILVWY